MFIELRGAMDTKSTYIINTEKLVCVKKEKNYDMGYVCRVYLTDDLSILCELSTYETLKNLLLVKDIDVVNNK